MTSTEQSLCTLLASSLFHVPSIISSNVDWASIQKEAEAQAVFGLIDWPEENIGVIQIEAKCLRILHAQNELINTLQDMPLVILKGTAAARYYPQPIRRTMGDVDFLVPQERFDEAVKLMENNDYSILNPGYTHPRHKAFIKSGVVFELHHHFSHDDLDIEDYLIEGLKHRVWDRIGRYDFPMLPPLANGLVLIDHLRNHLKEGLGLRQVLDWMMYVNQVLDDEFWDLEFGLITKEKGLETLAKTVTRMCQIYLGLPDSITWCKDADEELCAQLLSSLFHDGNFGRKQNEGQIIENVSNEIKRQGLFIYLQQTGENTWKAYHEHPSLKPLCWIYQLCRFARKGMRSRRGLKMIGDMRHSLERNKLLKDLGIQL